MAVHADPSPTVPAFPLPRSTGQSPSPGPVPGGRRPALDGVRGLAIALVVMHHFTQGFDHRPEGGFLGVDLFFVLSGYLITGLLVRSRLRTGRVRLSGFWLRRARRLLPPLLLVLALLAGILVWAGPPEARAFQRDDELSTLSYTANVHIMANLDLWGREQRSSLLAHTWSLAVEEQFYLVWPLLLAALLAIGARLGRLRTPAVCACAGLAAASFAWLARAYLSGTAGAGYFDTRSRIGELLVGAALALVLPGLQRRVSDRLGDRARRLWGAFALVALLGVLACVGTLDRERAAYYLGGAVVVTLATAVLVAAVETAPDGRVARCLGTAPLAGLGRTSYTLYLVHWPAMLLLPLPPSPTLGSALPVEIARLALSLGLATLSYLVLERPLLAGTLPWVGRSRPRLAVAGLVTTAGTVVVILSATSLPGNLDAQIRAVPAPLCPDQGLAALAACPLSSGSNHWVIAGDDQAAGLARALAGIPELGLTQAAWRSCGAWGLAAPLSPHPSSLIPVDPGLLCARDSPRLLADAVTRPGTRAVLVADGTSAQADLQAPDGGLDLAGTGPHDQLVRAALLHLVDTAAARGVRTVLLRQPPPSSGLAALLAPGSLAARAGQDQLLAERLRRYNLVLAAVAAARPDWASVVSIDDLVCPAGSCPALIRGLLVRHDGLAFAPAFARRIAPELAARIRRAITPPRRGG